MDTMSGELLEYLMDVARNCGGELLVIYDEKPVPRLIEFAKTHKARAIIMGRGPGGGPSAVVEMLKEALPQVNVYQPARQFGTVAELRQEGAL